MSKIDLAPAQTTLTGVYPSSLRSAEISIVLSPILWTPPIPPVTNTLMPTSAQIIMVAATVVLPNYLRAMTLERSLREHLKTPFCWERDWSWGSVRPTWMVPWRMAIVAGVAPASRIIFSREVAVS